MPARCGSCVLDEREEGVHAPPRLHVIEHALEARLAQRGRADRHAYHRVPAGGARGGGRVAQHDPGACQGGARGGGGDPEEFSSVHADSIPRIAREARRRRLPAPFPVPKGAIPGLGEIAVARHGSPCTVAPAFMAPNRPPRRLAALMFVGIAGAAFPAPRVPLEDFAHDQDFSNVQLSPDGQYLAFLHDYLGHPTVCTEPVGTSKVLQFDLGIAEPVGPAVQKGVSGYGWIGDDRLLLTTNVWNFYWYGTVAANRDAKEMTPISGLELIPHSSGILLDVNLEGLLWASQCIYNFDDEDRNILMLDDHSYNGTSILYPDVVKVNSFTGGSTTVMRNPGNVRSWGVDHRGQVRISLKDLGGSKTEVNYRDDEDSPWRILKLPKGMRKTNWFQFDSDNKHIFFAALSPEPSPPRRPTVASRQDRSCRSSMWRW